MVFLYIYISFIPVLSILQKVTFKVKLLRHHIMLSERTYISSIDVVNVEKFTGKKSRKGDRAEY